MTEIGGRQPAKGPQEGLCHRRVLQMHFGRGEGGSERFFVNLAREFCARGVEQQFVIRPGRSWREDLGPLGLVTENYGRSLAPSRLVLAQQLRRMRRDWRPDVVLAWMPRAAQALPDWPEALKIARLGDYPKRLGYFNRCDMLVCNTPGIAERCRELGWTRPMRIITNFPREVKPRPVSRADLGTPEDAFVVAGAGRFVEIKGFDVLVQAMAQVPEAWLWLVGDGEEREALERLARTEGMEKRIRFVGWVEEPVHHLAAADAVAFPSRHEPFGNVILEAWRAAVPVVASRSEGPSWSVEDGQSGLLVPIDDSGALAEALNRLRGNRRLAARLAAGGRVRLEGMFARERIVEQYLGLIAGVPAGTGSGREVG